MRFFFLPLLCLFLFSYRADGSASRTGLYVGPFQPSWKLETLNSLGVTHILCIAESREACVPPSLLPLCLTPPADFGDIEQSPLQAQVPREVRLQRPGNSRRRRSKLDSHLPRVRRRFPPSLEACTDGMTAQSSRLHRLGALGGRACSRPLRRRDQSFSFYCVRPSPTLLPPFSSDACDLDTAVRRTLWSPLA